MSSGQALWYLTRGSGVVALLLLTSTTLLGVLSAGRWRSERWPRFAVAALHRNLTLLAMVFIGVHVGTTIADGYAPIGVKDVFVPFASLYRPIWLGLGALAFDLLIAIAITSMLRKRIGYRMWRVLHWSAYATWPLALAHGLGSGSDARYSWMAVLSAACLASVVIAVAGRLYLSRSPSLRLFAGAVTVALILVLGTWYTSGPGKRGWASRAGTPSTLLKAKAATGTQSRQLASRVVVRPALRFNGRLVGHMSSSGPDDFGDAAVALAVAVRGTEPGVVRLTIWGTAIEDGGLRMSRSQVSFQDAVSGTAYKGSIVELSGNLVAADVTSSTGTTLRLHLRLRIDSAGAGVTGTINATPAAAAVSAG